MTKYIYVIAIIFTSSLIIGQDHSGFNNSGFILDDSVGVALAPKLYDLNNHNNPIVAKINKLILKEFGVSSYSESKPSYYLIDFVDYNIKNDILNINYHTMDKSTREYYPSYFYSLINGKELIVENYSKPKFKSIIKYDKYFSFLDKYWVSIAKEEFIESNNRFIEEGLTTYDFVLRDYYMTSEYRVKDDSISISHEFFRCTACFALAPFIIKDISLKEIEPYLNKFGRNELRNKKKDKNKIDKLLDKENNCIKPPHNIYLLGRIDDKYPFKMALNIYKIGEDKFIRGVYSYDKVKGQKLILKGYIKDGRYEINEYIGNNINGHFTIREESYYFWKGTWSNKDGSKTYDINFTREL